LRPFSGSVVVVALLLTPSSSRAEKPDPAASFLVGASSFVLGLGVGGAIVATANGNRTPTNAGWFAMESGFALGPVAAHAVGGEWVRGVVFGAPPAAAIGATAALFQYNPGTINSGTLVEQRWLWSFFCVGLLTGLAGVVDAALAGERTGMPAIALDIDKGRVGVDMRGSL
jgi:hypothetical protein